MKCEYCKGAGEYEVYWDQINCFGMSNEEAERKAGMVHHVETCEYCGGTGECDGDDEDL